MKGRWRTVSSKPRVPPGRTTSRSLTTSMRPKRSVRSVSRAARSGPLTVTTDGSMAMQPPPYTSPPRDRFVIFAPPVCLRGMRKLRLSLLTTLAGLLLLALPAIAAAHGGGDRDHDRMPDKWEKKHHLNRHRDDARKDADRDGLRNYAEYKSHTDPRDPDTDDDGIKDGNDVAGTVASFDGTTLVITLPDGSTRPGKVDQGTEVECHSTTAKAAHDGDGGNSGPGSSSSGPGRGGDDGDDDHGDDDRPATTTTPGTTTPAPRDDRDDDHGDDRGDEQGDDRGE